MQTKTIHHPLYRIAILGGTFDPIHLGHLTIAKHFSKQLHLDELILIPSGQPTHKKSTTDKHHRLAMTHIAADILNHQSKTKVKVSAEEIMRDGPSYTFDTLKSWRKKVGPQTSLSFLMGMDQLIAFNSWYRWKALFDMAHICVVNRPYFDYANVPQEMTIEIEKRQASIEFIMNHQNAGILIDNIPSVDISSTLLRQEIKALFLLKKMNPSTFFDKNLPLAIRQYIDQHQLYSH